MLHLSSTGRTSVARASALSCLFVCGITAVLCTEPLQAKTPDDRQAEIGSSAAYNDLMETDLIALRRDVAKWSNAYTGPTAARAKTHAATVHGIIDRLTIHKRQLEQNVDGVQSPAFVQEVHRLNKVWPAWLMGDFDPPPASRTILAKDAKQLRAALENAQAGDEIILADGIWEDLHLNSGLQSGGTGASPIVIRAQNPGHAVIATGFAAYQAENIILRDLTFRGLAAHATDQGNYAPSFAFGGKNVRISNCVFYAPQRSSGIIFNAAGLRFERNFVAGNFAGSAIRVNHNRCQLDANYFGWRSGEGSTSAAVEILHTGRNTVLRSNLFSGPGANVIDAGSHTLVEDNTFQNIPQTGLAISPRSRNAVVRNNMAFDVAGIEIASASAQFSNNYLEHVGLHIVAVGPNRNNTWIVDAGGNDREYTFDFSVLPGELNLVCTETKILWPREPHMSQGTSSFDSEEDTPAFQLMRDVLGYLRPHQDYGRLGFQGEALPLGRESEVGPLWLPADLSINRPLSRAFDSNPGGAPIATIGPSHQREAASPQVFLNATDSLANGDSERLPWTLQGWVHNRRGHAANCVIAQAGNGTDSWELRLTDDHRLVLAGETAGAAWSFSTESDYENAAGRSFFAIVIEPADQGYDVCFYRGNEIETVDLIAVELAPAGTFLGTSQFELIQTAEQNRGLISARLFALPTSTDSDLAILNASDLESLRQEDLLAR